MLLPGCTLRLGFMSEFQYLAGWFLGLAAAVCCIAQVQATDRSTGGTSTSLIDYVQRVLVVSDEAQAFQEDLVLAEDLVAGEEDQFRTIIRPVANLAVDASTRPRTGIEFSRRTRLGVDLSAGYATDGFGSGANARSFARLGIPVFQGFGRDATELGLARAELRLRRSQLDVERRLQQLSAQAIGNHIELVLARRLLTQSEAALGRAARHAAAAAARQRVGLVSRIDVHRAELARLDRRNAFERASYAAELEREEYAELAHLTLADVRVADVLPRLEMPDAAHFLPEQRPEWHMQRLDQQSARLELDSAERRMKPDLRFEVAWLGSEYGNGFENYAADSSDTYFSLRMDSDLNFTAKRRAVRTQKIAYDRSLRTGQMLERQLEREVRQAESSLQAEVRNMDVAAQKHAEAQRAMAVAQARFERGIASNLDVVDAEAEMVDAEHGELMASAAHVSSVVQLALARGVLSVAWLARSLAMGQQGDDPSSLEQRDEQKGVAFAISGVRAQQR